MNYTDEQLKRALAEMLRLDTVGNSIYWRNSREVLETELLHLCHLVEAGLFEGSLTHDDYLWELQKVCDPKAYTYKIAIYATWQQRTIALAKVKGVEI